MKLSSAKICLIKNSAFLICICLLAFYIRDVLVSIFMYNIQINSIILFCILSGVAIVYHRLFLYDREYSQLISFDKLSASDITKLKIIKPLFLHMNKSNRIISQTNMQTILGSIEKKVDDYASFPKYISGTLIFLGLLGTFWGLSHTIGNVADIIDSLGMENKDAATSFVQLKNSLKIPLSGMGIAFGCSLFGLSGSLLIGFLIVNMRKMSDNFLDKTESWLTKNCVRFELQNNQDQYHGHTFSTVLMEKTIETIYAFQSQLNQLEKNRISVIDLQIEVSKKLSRLTDVMGEHQDIIGKLSQSQIGAQSATKNLNEEISSKLDSIDGTLKHLLHESSNERKAMSQSLGNDIRMVSKVLSSLIRE